MMMPYCMATRSIAYLGLQKDAGNGLDFGGFTSTIIGPES